MANNDGATQPDDGMWMVRAGRGGIYADYFLRESVVAIGWGEVGEVDAQTPDREIRRLVNKAYPREKPKTRATWTSLVRRFIKDVGIGDPVVTYDNDSRMYHLGAIRSDAGRSSRKANGEDRQEFFRKVEWTAEVPRDSLSVPTKNRLGGILTLFRVPADASEELLQCAFQPAQNGAQDDEPPPASETDETDAIQEYIDKSDQFIEDAIAKLDWQQLQELVAGIIRAMGYKTIVSSPGPDGGVDIFASPDGLGLVEPRIFIEVKHRAGSVGAPAIRSFLGGRHEGDRCLYVSTGGFSRDARNQALGSNIPVTLIAMSQLRELLVEYYEALDSDTRDLVPLKRVYWPIRLSDS